ncbi:hypothetical protein HS5_05890 [Acidianus sp. HS-5]|nr:hypothetical protein HS5_05890 [Acidianus sp. HS-5]
MINKGIFNIIKLRNPIITTITPEIMRDLLGFPVIGINIYPIKAILIKSRSKHSSYEGNSYQYSINKYWKIQAFVFFIYFI